MLNNLSVSVTTFLYNLVMIKLLGKDGVAAITIILYLDILKESTNFQATIEYIQNSFTMNTKGDLVPKQEEQISLRSIYELMITKFDSIEIEIKDIKDDINLIKSLPTISKELNSLIK